MKGKWADLICWGDGGRGSAVGDGDRHQRRVDNCARTLSEKVLQGSVLGNPALCPSGVFMEGWKEREGRKCHLCRPQMQLGEAEFLLMDTDVYLKKWSPGLGVLRGHHSNGLPIFNGGMWRRVRCLYPGSNQLATNQEVPRVTACINPFNPHSWLICTYHVLSPFYRWENKTETVSHPVYEMELELEF